MELSAYIGKETKDVVSELENKGFKVIVVNNSFKSFNNSKSLVVKIKLLEEKVVELISGDFSFLS